ncbi:MAG: methyltransferase domain-containing protein [Cocleimonas sp.]
MIKETNEWEGFYQAGTIGWDRGISSTNLDYWLDNDLLKPCRILIPGCGNGYEAIKLAELGFEVVAIDIAPSPINNLKAALDKNKLKAELVLKDFLKWNPEDKFDAIFEQTSLCALPPELWKQYETQLQRWLKPQGKLYAQFMQTGKDTGPPYHCELNDMVELFPKSRWNWSEKHSLQEKEAGKVELLYLLETSA